MQNTISPNVALVNQVMEEGRSLGIIHHSINSHSSDKAKLVINGKQVTHFGNCGYLALANDPRLKHAAIDVCELLLPRRSGKFVGQNFWQAHYPFAKHHPRTHGGYSRFDTSWRCDYH
jgi:hypothetical protein